MKIKNIILAILASSIFLFQGCGSDPKRIASDDPNRLVSNDVDSRDIQEAATKLINEVLASGKLDAYKPKPIRLKLASVRNETRSELNMNIVSDRILMGLNNSGDISAMAEDATTKELARLNQLETGNVAPTPKLTMLVTLRELESRVGRSKEISYFFYVKINNNLGDTIWSGEREIAKSSTRSSVGW